MQIDSEAHKYHVRSSSKKGPESLLNVFRFDLKSRKRELLKDRKKT